MFGVVAIGTPNWWVCVSHATAAPVSYVHMVASKEVGSRVTTGESVPGSAGGLVKLTALAADS